MRVRTIWVCGAATAMLMSACGDDDDGGEAATTEAPAAITEASTPPDEAETASTDASAPDGTEGTLPVPDEICPLAEQMFEQEDFPSAAQLEKYQELAPDEIGEAVALATEELLASEGDPVALFNAFGQDDVEEAIDEIDAWEEENCDIPHSEDNALPDDASQEVEDDATRVDVTATDYAFEIGAVEAGRTSFVLANEGAEAHFLLIVKLAEGVTLEDAMASEGEEGTIEGEWETRLASAGDDEAITFDVEPGTYGLLCFVPTADGTPHAMLGMQEEITVT